MKIAMFGGSFDPIHNDHIKLCETMIESFSIDKVVVFPAACSPFKKGTVTEDYHRLNMCRLAFENNSKVEVSDFEIKKGGKSYTVDTLEFLKKEYQGSELYLITGADAFLTLDNWYHSAEIFKSAHILTVVREDDDIDDLKLKADEYKNLDAECSLLSIPIGTISSTKVRKALLMRDDVSTFLPDKVTEYIKENRLYGYAD